MDLSIVSLNVDSIVHFNRRILFENFIRENKIDICLAQETKLDDKIKFNFLGYNIIRGDDIRGRCGTAIILRSCIPIRNPAFYNDVFQSTSIEIYVNNSWAKISSVYFPPGRCVDRKTFDNFFDKHQKSLLGGDFNGRNTLFGDYSSNMYGILLGDSISLRGGYILNPPSPTCYHSINGSFIDKFINLNSPIIVSNITLVASFSDHAGIRVSAPHTIPSSTITKNLNFDLANMEKINCFLKLSLKRIVLPLHENLDENQLGAVTAEFNDIIGRAIKKFVPQTP